jgi:PKD repeat protein
VVHVYEEAGNYTVTLYLTDAGARTDAAKVVMAVGEAKAKAGTVLRTESRKFTDSKACGLTDGIASPAKTSTFEWVFYANETDGTPSAVANVTIKGGPTDTKFIGPDGKEIAKGATIEAKGPFEAGKYKITATSNCAAGSTAAREHKLDASATYVAT